MNQRLATTSGQPRWDAMNFEVCSPSTNSSQNPRERGSTLTTVVVILVLIVIVGGVIFAPGFIAVSVSGRSDAAKVMLIKSELQSISMAAEFFNEDHGRWPNSLRELEEPPALADGEQMAYVRRPLLDPFTEEPFMFTRTQTGVSIGSYGSDGKEGGEGNAADLFMTAPRPR